MTRMDGGRLMLRWTARLEHIPTRVRIGVIVVLLSVVALVDELTGPDLSLALLYSLCVMAAAWFVSRTGGLLTVVAATAVGLLVRIASERQESWPVLTANTTLRAVSLTLFALLTAGMRSSIDELVRDVGTDAMTGAMSRQGFLDALAAARRRAERDRTPIGVAYFDLDGLKAVNDVRGHAAGDALIRHFVERVSMHLRSTDAFGRLGGDEFAIALERASQDVIGAVVQRVLDDPGLPDASCGVAVFEGNYPSPAKMLAGADRRMYKDKQFRRGGLPPASPTTRRSP